MHRFYILLFLWLITTAGSAQTLLIEYNYQRPADSRWADLVGADTVYHPVSEPIQIRRPHAVQVVVRNVNLEAVRPEVTLRQSLSLDSTFRTSMSSLMNTVATLAAPAGLDLKSMLALKSRGADAKQLPYVPMQVDLDEVRAFESESVVDLDEHIRSRLTEVQKWQQVRDQLRQLRYDPTLTKADAQVRCQRAAQQLTEQAQTLLNDPIKARQTVERIALENAEYLKFALASLQHKSSSAATTATPTARGDQPTAAPVFTDFIIAEMVRLHQKAIPDDLATQLTQILTDIITNYHAAQSNPYRTTFQANADKQTERLTLHFYEATSPSGTSARRLLRSEPFSFRQAKQLQIATSFGLSFLAYNQRLQSYGVVNGKVAASDLDGLVPSLAGFFQVVNRSETASVRLGAHLGVAVPLTEARGVCFLLGPTIGLGKRSAVLLNAGVFTGRVTRLGAGLNVGDTYSGTLPTAMRYEWGYQAGLSYQLNLKR